jgi:hypothetical protein
MDQGMWQYEAALLKIAIARALQLAWAVLAEAKPD